MPKSTHTLKVAPLVKKRKKKVVKITTGGDVEATEIDLNTGDNDNG